MATLTIHAKDAQGTPLLYDGVHSGLSFTAGEALISEENFNLEKKFFCYFCRFVVKREDDSIVNLEDPTYSTDSAERRMQNIQAQAVFLAQTKPEVVVAITKNVMDATANAMAATTAAAAKLIIDEQAAQGGA
jgi:hypothetical protein